MVVALEQHDIGARARRGDRRRGARGPAADHQHVAVAVNGNFAGRLAQRAEIGPVGARALALEYVRDQQAFFGGLAGNHVNQQSKNTVSSRPCRITFHFSAAVLPATFFATSVPRRPTGTSASTGSSALAGSSGK